MDSLCASLLPLVRRRRVDPEPPKTPPTLHDDYFHPSLRQYVEMDGELAYLQIVLPSDKAWRTHNYYKLVERQRNNPPAARQSSQCHVISMSLESVCECGVEDEEIPVVLPSDPQWRLEIYFHMLDSQKHPMPVPWPETEEESEAKRPRVSDESGRSRECRRSIQSAGGVCWTSSDLALAAKLLETPNARFPTITFSNVEEKRRVFTLVYDVLRYKSVLNQALNDVYFFTRNAYLKERCHLVWLLFLDLYKRDFTLREPLDAEVEASFRAQGLFEIDEVLWQLRVKLAATVSRLRIKSGAHSLSDLLPRHLQVNRSAQEENIVSGWVNIFKTSLMDTCAYLENCGFMTLPRDREVLEQLTYKTDHLLPRFLHIMPNAREDLVESPLLQDHHIVMQERTFCLGPAVMAQLLKDFALSGKVAQTHVNSPITMAYFANLLINNDKIESLLVFGAGYRKEACEQYLKELGVKNTLVFSENFATLSPENRVLDNVIAVLATPPNTNSSVVDPVDLAVARGGDLQILQQLTDDDFASTPRGDNINKFLRDQRDTLRRGMSKPQIQFIVYETHSRFHCENEEMAANLVNELNNYAREVHLEELRRAQGETQERERIQAETTESPVEVPTIRVDEELNIPLPSPTQSVQIPPSDLFEMADIPDLCPNFENCLDLQSEGTYIAVIKRKEITRLDPKYMIQMAEARGLFGRPDATPKAKTPGQTARAKAALAALQARSDSMEKSKTKVKVEMDRIAAPTRASLLRDVHPPSDKDCPRFTHHLAHDGTPSYLYPEPVPRKTFLTAEEEEELIGRLYICPQLNLFPPRLYEDLPPLKFWSSPATVVEHFLQRKIFQRRLQMAYEYNQSKETGEGIFHKAAEESADQLAKAVNQLANNISYYNTLNNEIFSSESIRTKGCGERNKELWDEIRPVKMTTPPMENTELIDKEKISANDTKITKLRKEIKNRFSDYKNVYRLKNLSSNTNPPLVSTIDKSLCVDRKEFSKEGNCLSRIYNSGSQENFKGIFKAEKDSIPQFTEHNYLAESIEFSENSSEEYENSIDYTNKLPSLKSVSEYNFQNTTNLKKVLTKYESEKADLDRDFPQLPLATGAYKIVNRRGTLLTLRDSVELAHKRLPSRVSRYSQGHDDAFHPTFQKHTFDYNDSYSMLTNHLPNISDQTSVKTNQNQYNSNSHSYKMSITPKTKTILSHRDSLLLASQRISSKEKRIENLSCDVCNNQESKSIQFLCDHHANLSTSNQHRHHSIMMKSKSCQSRDSVVIAKKRFSLKENRKSVACQVNEIHTEGEILHFDETVKKGRKMSKQDDKLKTNAVMKKSLSKLKKKSYGCCSDQWSWS